MTRIELFHKPCPRGTGNLSRGNQIQMIKQDLPVGVGIEDGMIDSHSRLV
jgi:hypothetical protein